MDEIIPNKKLRKEFNIVLENTSIEKPNIFGIDALIAAYNEGEEWLEQVLEYLEGNLKYTMKFFKERIPKLKIIKPEGTYLVWVDCPKLNMTSTEMKDFFAKKVKLGFNNGVMFGKEGEKFQRINIACSREIIKEALERMEKEVNKLDI